MNRRRFLASGLASLGAACAPVGVQTAPTSSEVALGDVRRLIVERADPIAGRCRYVADLGARQVAQPILVARRGERFDAVIENRLPQPTTVHFHGLTLPAAQDGAGFSPIPPGEGRRVQFEVRNRSGLYWFHPHPHGFTAEQVQAGLAGLLVVKDEDDEALDAALGLAPQNRLALAIADVRVAAGEIRPYAPDAHDCLHGWLGNRALANGRLDAFWDVAPGWVRLQILNACNARGLLLAFRDGETTVPFHLLGSDGGLFAAPQALERVFLYGAERVDVAIDTGERQSLAAVSLQFDPRHHAHGEAASHVHAVRAPYAPLAAGTVCQGGSSGAAPDALPDGAALPLFSLRVRGSAARATPRLPEQLSALADAGAAEPPTRRLRLDFDPRSGFLIDETPYRIDEPGWRVSRDTREVWEIKNSPISMPHAMHLHGFAFRVLRRQGTFGPARALATASAGRLPTDLGVKDTVVVWPNETVWIAVDFTLPRDAAFGGAQRFMFHCHNLEHEDGMMMRNVTVA